MTTSSKILNFKEAISCVNEETNLQELLLELRKEVVPNEYSNKKFFQSEMPFGKSKLNKGKSEKMPVVCPFHDTDNDGSTSILLGKVDVIKCFRGGCAAKKAVSPISAYMILALGVNPDLIGSKSVGREFAKTVYYLANRLGIVVQDEDIPLTPEQEEAKTTEEILKKTTEIYHQAFLDSKEAQDYFFEQRGFKYATGDPWELVKKHKIGFAPDAFPSQFLYDKLAPDYTTDEMLRAGIVRWVEFKDEHGNLIEEKPLDFHSQAITISYWEKNYRKVTNIYSRGLYAEKKWRHLRLPGAVDIPINFDEGVRHEEILLLEGELSLYSIFALGYENGLGNRGTNGLSNEHIEMLVKAREQSNGQFCKTVFICFDGDKPGREATKSTGELLLSNDFDVRVIILADGEDPNDILVNKKENAKAYFDKMKTEAVSYYTFLALSHITENNYNTADNLKEFQGIKNTLEEHGIVDLVELQLVAMEFSQRKKIPFEIVWDAWSKKNKETDVFANQKFAFITNDYDSFVLTRHVFPGKTAYIEDVSFSFLKEKTVIKNLVMDADSYTESEKSEIVSFCSDNGIQLFPLNEFGKIIDTEPSVLMEKLSTMKDKIRN